MILTSWRKQGFLTSPHFLLALKVLMTSFFLLSYDMVEGMGQHKQPIIREGRETWCNKNATWQRNPCEVLKSTWCSLWLFHTSCGGEILLSFRHKTDRMFVSTLFTIMWLTCHCMYDINNAWKSKTFQLFLYFNYKSLVQMICILRLSSTQSSNLWLFHL